MSKFTIAAFSLTLTLLALLILTILFGIYPKPILDVMSASVNKLLGDYSQALLIADQVKFALHP